MTAFRFAAFAALLLLSANSTRADLGPLEPLADLHRAIHESLGLPEPMIVRLLERGLPEPELPAIGWIAQRTGTPVERVADLRFSGLPLVDISIRLGSGPELFYVPFESDPGPPYGKAWGHYRKTPRARWHEIRLSDAEIVHLANLHLITRRYSISPRRALDLERSGKSVAAIHRELSHPGHGGSVHGGNGHQSAKSHGNSKAHEPGSQGKKNRKEHAAKKPPR